MRPVRPPRSFAGPIVLIIIGILGLLGTMGMLEWHRVFLWFAHFWPALLILWGIIKLIEYQQANRSGVRSGGIGAGGVLLIIFLVIAGLTATSLSRVDWQHVREGFNIDDGEPWWGHSYNYTDDIQKAFPADGTLKVTNEHGAVNVNASDDGWEPTYGVGIGAHFGSIGVRAEYESFQVSDFDFDVNTVSLSVTYTFL